MPRPLVLLLAAALAQSLAWVALTPPLQGPDESEHVAYIQQLAETGHAPKANSGTGTTSSEQAALAYGLNLLPMRGHFDGRPTWGAESSVSRAADALPAKARKDGTGPNAVAQNPPLYYAMQAVVYRLAPDHSLLARITAMRLANVLIYLVGVALMWLLSAEIFSRTWLRVLATTLVIAQPKLIAISGYVNPDMLLFTIATGFMFAAVRLVGKGATTRRVATVAGLAGAATLTHGRGLFLLVPAAISIAIACARLPSPRLRHGARTAAIGGFVVAIPLLIALLWTRAQTGGSAYGGQLSSATSNAFDVRQFLSYVWQFFFPKLSFMDPTIGPPYGYRQVFIESYFGSWGNYEVNFTPATYDVFQVAACVGLIMLVVTVVLRWRDVVARWPTVAIVAISVTSLIALLLISNYRNLQGSGSPVITGRYLMSGIAGYGIAIAWVIGSLPRRFAPLVGTALTAAAVVVAVQALLINIGRFYG